MGPIKPPAFVRLREADAPIWDAIVTARPRDTWTDADLVLAAHLARAYGDIAQMEAVLDEEGMLVDGEIHPACALLEKLSRRALALARQLKVDTISVVGKSQDIHKGADLERSARNGVDDDDGLIPRPLQ